MRDHKRMFYVYILTLKNGRHYVGYTTNMDDRYARHVRGEGCRTTERMRGIFGFLRGFPQQREGTRFRAVSEELFRTCFSEQSVDGKELRGALPCIFQIKVHSNTNYVHQSERRSTG